MIRKDKDDKEGWRWKERMKMIKKDVDDRKDEDDKEGWRWKRRMKMIKKDEDDKEGWRS